MSEIPSVDAALRWAAAMDHSGAKILAAEITRLRAEVEALKTAAKSEWSARNEAERRASGYKAQLETCQNVNAMVISEVVARAVGAEKERDEAKNLSVTLRIDLDKAIQHSAGKCPYLAEVQEIKIERDDAEKDRDTLAAEAGRLRAELRAQQIREHESACGVNAPFHTNVCKELLFALDDTLNAAALLAEVRVKTLEDFAREIGHVAADCKGCDFCVAARIAREKAAQAREEGKR